MHTYEHTHVHTCTHAHTHTHRHRHTHSDSILNSSDHETLHLQLLGLSSLSIIMYSAKVQWSQFQVKKWRKINSPGFDRPTLSLSLEMWQWRHCWSLHGGGFEHPGTTVKLREFVSILLPQKLQDIEWHKKLLSSLNNQWHLTTCIYAPMFSFCDREISMYYF